MKAVSSEQKQFRSPEEEVAHIRQKIGKKGKTGHNELIRSEIERYAREPMEILAKGHRMIFTDIEAKVHGLRESRTFGKTKLSEDILALFNKKGMRNSLAVVDTFGDINAKNDFHTYLVEHLDKKAGSDKKRSLFSDVFRLRS